MKKGEIYKVLDYENNPHRVVLMEDYVDGMQKLKVVAFTHDPQGGPHITNLRMEKVHFEEVDETGIKYEFQWEEFPDGRVTSMMTTGFIKLENLIDHIVGKVTNLGMEFIIKNVKEYIDCPVAVNEYKG